MSNEVREELKPRQVEMLAELLEIVERTGEVPVLAKLEEDENCSLTRGKINWHFGSYARMLELAGLPPTKRSRRWGTKQLMLVLRGYILELGRVPTRSEVRENPNLPVEETYLRFYPDWESVVLALGFSISWCSAQTRQKLLDDLWKKYVVLGYQLPGPMEIQSDPAMEKVCVYTQIFGDLRSAWVVAGIWDDFCRRQREEVGKTVLEIYAKLGRVPRMRDPGMPNEKLIAKLYGSYVAMLEELGITPSHQKYTRKKLIQQLKRKYQELGRSPMAKEIDADPEMASAAAFRRVFGSNAKALKAAGLPPLSVPQRRHYEKTELIQQLQAKYQQLGRAPVTREVNEDPEMAHSSIFSRAFGGFKLALEAAGIPTHRRFAKYSREDLIAQLQTKATELGRAPRLKEVDGDKGMASANIFENEFGCFNAALEAAGLKVSKKREYTDEELLDDLERKYIALRFLKTGKRPTNKDINADPEMASTRAYDVHFGGTSAARKIVEQRLRSRTILATSAS